MPKIIYPFSFNGVDLPTVVQGLTVLKTDPYKVAKRTIQMAQIARSNSGKVNSALYTERDITVKVEIDRPTRDLVEQSVDTLMGYLQQVEKLLVLNQSGTSRAYTATLADAPVTEDGAARQVIDLIFGCSDRYGYDLANTLLHQFAGYTSANKSDQIKVDGSAEWQVPTITITFNALTSAVSKTVSVGNSNTGQGIRVVRTWVPGDVLVINALENTVKVNGVDVAFSGAIPNWRSGDQYWYYSDEFATRNISGNIVYKKRYA